MHSLTDLRDLAIEIATDVGAFQVEQRRDGRPESTTKAHANDFVSFVDQESERRIRERLLTERPDDAVLGEEEGQSEGTSGYRWIVDPLDGTRNYLHDNGPWSTSIGLEHQGELVMGVVHDPARSETFAAVRGGGATLNGRPITTSNADSIESVIFGASFAPSTDVKQQMSRALVHLLPALGDMRRIPAALLLSYVAAGRLDSGILLGTQYYDVAAGLVIAQEAGAVITDEHGGTWRQECIVLATPAVAGEFQSLVSSALRD